MKVNPVLTWYNRLADRVECMRKPPKAFPGDVHMQDRSNTPAYFHSTTLSLAEQSPTLFEIREHLHGSVKREIKLKRTRDMVCEPRRKGATELEGIGGGDIG